MKMRVSKRASEQTSRRKFQQTFSEHGELPSVGLRTSGWWETCARGPIDTHLHRREPHTAAHHRTFIQRIHSSLARSFPATIRDICITRNIVFRIFCRTPEGQGTHYLSNVFSAMCCRCPRFFLSDRSSFQLLFASLLTGII